MTAVSLTASTSVEGDAPHNAATAYACGWRIDTDHQWERALKAHEPKEPPHSGHIRDGHVFVACACSASAFDRGDLAYSCETHT